MSGEDLTTFLLYSTSNLGTGVLHLSGVRPNCRNCSTTSTNSYDSTTKNFSDSGFLLLVLHSTGQPGSLIDGDIVLVLSRIPIPYDPPDSTLQCRGVRSGTKPFQTHLTYIRGPWSGFQELTVSWDPSVRYNEEPLPTETPVSVSEPQVRVETETHNTLECTRDSTSKV